MERTINTRRDFLKFASAAMALPLVLSCQPGSAAQVLNEKC